MPTVHALLVGINEYVNLPPLHGCVRDIEAIETLLTARVGPALSVRKLVNAQATRAAIIEGFTGFLAQAKPEDIALFYFCGHGSEEECPPEWHVLEPRKKNQTIVPVDARANGVFDIADKELSTLIAQVAATGAQVVTMFDSCHSGDNTRDGDAPDYAVRAADATGPKRSLSDYLPATVALYDPQRLAEVGAPKPRHISLAACQAFETAKEQPRETSSRRGAFTAAVEQVLASMGNSATYVDLLQSVRAKVRAKAREQTPLLTTVGGADPGTRFLGGHAGRRDLGITIDDDGAIWLAAGTAAGVSDPREGGSTEVAIHLRGALDDATARPTPLAMATVTEAAADRARLTLVGDVTLDAAQAYIAEITKLGVPHLTVRVEGTEPHASEVRAALADKSGLYAVTDTELPGVPSVTVQVTDTVTRILDARGTPIPEQEFRIVPPDPDKPVANRHLALCFALLHLAKWHGLRDRTPAVSSLNGIVAIELYTLTEQEKALPADRQPLEPVNGVLTLDNLGVDGRKVKIRLHNQWTDKLYVVAVNLTDAYASDVLFADWIPGGGEGLLFDGQIRRLKVPKWRGPAATEGTSILKVFAAKDSLTAAELKLDALIIGASGSATRGDFDVEMDEPDASFWGTTQVTLLTKR